MSQTTTAAGLLARAQQGDKEAFEAFIAPLVEPGYNLAFMILCHRQDAEDAVQEASLKAWRKIKQLKDAGAARSWFLKVVANECRMSRRGRWTSVIKLPELQASSPPSVDGLAETTDLRRAVAQLAEADRAVVFLYFGLDLALSEVGTVLGISAGAAKSRLYRALGKLRPILGEIGDLTESIT